MKNAQDLRVGDIIEFNGKEYEIYAVRPTHRTYGEDAGQKFIGHETGITFIDEDDYESWVPIDFVKFVRRPGNGEENITMSDLVRKLNEVERRIAAIETQLRVVREDIKLVEGGAAADIESLSKRIATLECHTDSGTLTRDEVIERAKADIADLRKLAGTFVPNSLTQRTVFWPHSKEPTEYFPLDHVNYVVNRKKRTVVALISDKGGVWAKGTAKCAPGDVFNVHIGKAIALHRALGLKVLNEYLNAPQPAEPRVGDVVEWKSSLQGWVPTILTERAPQFDNSEYGNLAFYHTGFSGWIANGQFRIIDDSRDNEYAAKGDVA